QPADEDAQRPVGNANHLVDDGDRPDLVDVVPAGDVDRGVTCRHEGDQAVARDDVVDQADGALLPDRERRHRLWEDDGLLQRQHGQRARELDLGLDLGWSVEGDVAHSAPTSIETRPRGVSFSVTGSVTVTTPCSYRACARPRSTSSGMRARRRPGRAWRSLGCQETPPTPLRRWGAPALASTRSPTTRSSEAGSTPGSSITTLSPWGSSVWKESTFGRNPRRVPANRGTC